MAWPSKVTLNILLLVLLVNAAKAGSRPWFPPQRHRGSSTCNYRVEIETTCADSAETGDGIRVRFADGHGNEVVSETLKTGNHEHRLVYSPNPSMRTSGKAFSKCGIDSFVVSGHCMDSAICTFFVKQFGSDEWRPGWARVYSQSGSSSALKFYFRVFIPTNVWFGFDYCNGNGAFPHPPHPTLPFIRPLD